MIPKHIYKVEGIVLKRRNSGEADKILTIFTKQYGKIKVVAKGVRKSNSRRGPHLEIFSQALFVLYQGKNLDSVSEVKAIDVYGGLRSDLKTVRIAYFLCELIDSLTAEKQDHPDIYLLLCQALQSIDRGRPFSLAQFSLEVLRVLGFLSQKRELRSSQIIPFIESITERKMRTPPIIRQFT